MQLMPAHKPGVSVQASTQETEAGASGPCLQRRKRKKNIRVQIELALRPQSGQRLTLLLKRPFVSQGKDARNKGLEAYMMW